MKFGILFWFKDEDGTESTLKRIGLKIERIENTYFVEESEIALHALHFMLHIHSFSCLLFMFAILFFFFLVYFLANLTGCYFYRTSTDLVSKGELWWSTDSG